LAGVGEGGGKVEEEGGGAREVEEGGGAREVEERGGAVQEQNHLLKKVNQA